MIIDHVETIPYSIPFDHAMTFASGAVVNADHVLLRIHTDAGAVGVADIPPRPYTYGETQASIVAVIADLFTPALLGRSPLERGAIHAELNRTIGNNAAKGGVDIALWDLIGLGLSTPVSQLLGGYASSAAVSHMLGFATPSEVLDEAQRMHDQYGIQSFKLKVGRRPLDADIQSFIALRAAFGPEVDIYLDANRGWSAVEASEVLRRLDGLLPSLLEEPCDAKEIMGRRRLVDQSPIPIVGDESTPTLGDAARELTSGGCNALSIKTARTGFTESQKILALAEGLGVEVVVGNQVDTQVGSVASVVFAAAHEKTTRRGAELSNFLGLSDDLLAEPLQIRGGRIAVPRVAGVGAVIDEDKLSHYRVDERVS